MTNAPLIAARDLRVDVDGAVALDGVSFESGGPSLAVWGDSYALERALAGSAKVRSGSLAVLGVEVEARAAFSSDRFGIALCDPPLPPRWSVRDFLLAGAKLAGAPHSAAREAVGRALDEHGLQSVANQELRALPLATRRAVLIAEATLMSPSLLIAVAPLAGLTGEPASYVAAALAKASLGRHWIVSVRDLHPASPEHALALSAHEVVGLAGGKLVQQGKLLRGGAVTTGYTLVIRGKVDALRRALTDRGVHLAGGPLRYYVELTSELAPNDILALANQVRAPIIELVPRLATAARPQLAR